MRDAVEEFMAYNRPFARRNAELMRYKVARMAEGPFAFYRGTFHLFARDVVGGLAGALPLLTGAGPELDLVGDVHAENFGTFKADDKQVHYDVNDFDETTRGRFDLDVCRLATSHFLAVQELRAPLEEGVRVTLAGLREYVRTFERLVKKGKDLRVDVSESQPSGSPAVDALVRRCAGAKRGDFIAGLTRVEGGSRRVVRTADHYNLTEEERAQALRLLADYRKRSPKEDEKFFEVDDVCGWVSGIGSMGRLRYVLLLAGKGSKEGRNVLLELKESLPSAYDVCRGREQDAGAAGRRAERVVSVQRESQAASDGFVGWAVDGSQSFQARQRGPADERVRLGKLDASAVEGVARVQCSILARVHARSAMRAVGPSNPLAELEDAGAFCQRVLAFALEYADLARRDWQRFAGARAELGRVEGWAGG